MSLSSWLLGTSKSQSAADANANLILLSQERLEQLRRKWEAGTITKGQLEELARLEGKDPSWYSAESYLDAGWDEFEEQSWQSVKAIPGAVGNAVGGTLGNISGGVAKGFFKGFANPVTIALGIGGLLVAFWALTKGPLKNLNITKL